MRMSHNLPTYMKPSTTGYHSLGSESQESYNHDSSNNNNNNNASKANPSKSFTSKRIAVVLFLAFFAIISGRWIKSHPTFIEDIRIARTISVNAHITLYPTIIPYEGPTSQEMPVPEIDTLSILGVSNSPKWKTSIATANIPAFPRKIVPGPSAPSTDEILFAMATNADRAISQAQWWLWPSFLTNPSSPCFVLLPPEDAHRTEEVIAQFKERGLNCIAKASHQKRYQRRVLALPREAKEAWQDKSKNIKWLIMGDE